MGVELELDNKQFSLLRAEVRSESGLRRVESCLKKLLRRLDSTKQRRNFISIRWLLLWSNFTLRIFAIETSSLKTSFVDEMKLVVKIKDMGLSKLSAQFSRPFVGRHSTLPTRSYRVSGPVCFAVLSLTASRFDCWGLCVVLYILLCPSARAGRSSRSCNSKF